MSTGDIIGLAGIVITVIFGIWAGARYSKRRSQSQKQNANRGSTAIQSGRDSHISRTQRD